MAELTTSRRCALPNLSFPGLVPNESPQPHLKSVPQRLHHLPGGTGARPCSRQSCRQSECNRDLQKKRKETVNSGFAHGHATPTPRHAANLSLRVRLISLTLNSTNPESSLSLPCTGTSRAEDVYLPLSVSHHSLALFSQIWNHLSQSS